LLASHRFHPTISGISSLRRQGWRLPSSPSFQVSAPSFHLSSSHYQSDFPPGALHRMCTPLFLDKGNMAVRRPPPPPFLGTVAHFDTLPLVLEWQGLLTSFSPFRSYPRATLHLTMLVLTATRRRLERTVSPTVPLSLGFRGGVFFTSSSRPPHPRSPRATRPIARDEDLFFDVLL